MSVTKKQVLDALDLLYSCCMPSGSLALYNAKKNAKKGLDDAAKESIKKSGEE